MPENTKRKELKQIIQDSLIIARTEGIRVLVKDILEKIAKREFKVLCELPGSILYADKTSLVASSASNIDQDGYLRFDIDLQENDQSRAETSVLLVTNTISFDIVQAVERVRSQQDVTINNFMLVSRDQSENIRKFAREYGLLSKTHSQIRSTLESEANVNGFCVYLKGGAIPVGLRLIREVLKVFATEADIDAVLVKRLPRCKADETWCQLNWNSYRAMRNASTLNGGIVCYDQDQDIIPLEEPFVCLRTRALKQCLPALSGETIFADDLVSAGIRVVYSLRHAVIYSPDWSPSFYVRNGFVNWKNRILRTEYQFPNELANIHSLTTLLDISLEMYRRLNFGIDSLVPLREQGISESLLAIKAFMQTSSSGEGGNRCEELRQLLDSMSKVARGQHSSVDRVPDYLVSRWTKAVGEFGLWVDSTGVDGDCSDTLFKILAFEIGRAIAEYESYYRDDQRYESINTILAMDAD